MIQYDCQQQLEFMKGIRNKNMEINIFEIVEKLNKELNTLQEIKDIIKEWAGYGSEDTVYPAMTKICKLLNISVGWCYDE